MQAWIILIALTLARSAMAFQFQSIAALSPQLSSQLGLSFVAIGTLAGAYLLPGAVAALFGGWAGQRFGDIRIALGGLILMALGGFAGAWFTGFEAQLTARFVAGIGAVALNVMLTKMAGDWFQGRGSLPVAMGILVSSWPMGLALAMLALPLLSQSLALGTLLMLPAWVSLAAFLGLVSVWRSPSKGTTGAATTARPRLTKPELCLILLSGSIWALYNVAFIGILTWSPGILAIHGLTETQATANSSLISWVAILSVALGGWIARSLPRPDGAALGCFALSAVVVVVFVYGGPSMGNPAFLAIIGFLIGPAAAMVMTLPIESTRVEVRAWALGVYWAVYYVAMGVAPGLLGVLRETTHSAAAPLVLAASIMALCALLWLWFRRLQMGYANAAEETKLGS